MPNAMLDTVPSLDPRQQHRPRNSLMDLLEQFSIGAGQGLQNNLVGLGQMLAHPIQSAQGMYQAASHPIQTANAMMDYGAQSLQSPMGVGQFMGEMFDPSMVRSLGRMAPKAVRSEMTAYHGSPHDFDAFDSSKIGTGEGAQAYGHGLYFAEDPKVAGSYARTLSNRDMEGYANAHLNAQNLVAKLGGDADYAAQAIKDSLGTLNNADPNYDRLSKTLEMIESGKYSKPLDNHGKLYNVDIPDEAIDKMLDWDAPLSEQPDVALALKSLAPEGFDQFDSPALAALMTGKHPRGMAYDPPAHEVLADLASEIGVHHNSPEFSAMLKQKGIPGIRYLDAGSRGYRILDPHNSVHNKWTVGRPDGSDMKTFSNEADARAHLKEKTKRNFVVFDDKIVKILNKE